MNTLFGCIVGIVFAPCFCLAQSTVPGTWKSFTSSTGFTVSYPGRWVRKGISKDRLTILSSKNGAEGIVIRKGEAVITVSVANGNTDAHLSQVIAHYAQGTTVLSRKTVVNSDTNNRECVHIKEIVSKEPVVPPKDVPEPVPYIVNTELFCKVHRNVYATVLRNWEGDKKQARYQAVAVKMAESLRRDRKNRGPK